MNILIATSEAEPFARTGGLGDVCGSLPKALAAVGQQVSVILPAYRAARAAGQPIAETGCQFDVPIGSKTVHGRILKSQLPNSTVPVYLVAQDDYFDRPGIYTDTDGKEYKDNCERYVFFCRGVLEAIRQLDLRTELIHLNDWTTGLIPAYLKTELAGVPPFESIATLMTIHNLAYQGTFWHWDMLLTGIDWKYFNWRQMEFHGNLNLLKTGIVFADAISTVSPTYAQEIQHEPLGCGLEDLLFYRSDKLTGIVNGVDDHSWNPASDASLAANYDATTVSQGKAKCKAALQEEMGLPQRPSTPLLGLVGRLVEQKGIDLVTHVIDRWAGHLDAQWVILGTGSKQHEEELATLAARFPERVAVKIGFLDALARRIEAGSDMFLMPSRYEPCGLNQLYSLKYGSVPIVRATGGLRDTVTDVSLTTLADGTATGFCFEEYAATELAAAVQRACQYFSQRDVWARLIQNGMRQDWSWTASAAKYVSLYQQILARRRQPARV